MKLIEVFRQWCRNYVVFTKSILFILGLIFSYKLVEKTFLNILITRLTDAWVEYDFRRAVVVVNLQEGTSALLVMFFAYAADVHSGRFKMAVFSTAVCIIGLLLNSLAAGNKDDGRLKFGLFYPALGLMTLAQAAQTFTLRAFLDDQLRPRDLTAVYDSENTAWRRSMFWWYVVSLVAAIFAQFGPLAGLTFRRLAIVLSSLMWGCFLVFLLGTKYYIFVATIPNPFKGVGSVIVRAIAKRKVKYPQTPEELFHNPSGDLHITPRIPWLRWLDRAAIVRGIQAGNGSPSTVEQVRRVKLLLKMLPLWSCFLTVSLVSASGSTFFFEEAYSLNGNNIRNIIFFANLQRFTEFAVSETSNYIIGKLKRYNEQKMELVRIGIGMSCCVLCCITAWATAARRQRELERDNMMSVYWLTPRYLLLGLIGGLSQDGLQLFYKSQVLESLFRFGPPFVELMMGVGRYLSIVFILIFSTRRFEWFARDLDKSRLDRYYIFLAALSFGNFVIYCLVVRWYGDDAFLLEDEEIGIVHQLVVELEGKQIHHPSLTQRTLSKPGEKSGGEDIAESSSSRQEAESPEDLLLASSESTKNISKYNYVLLRAVTMFSRLSSRAARRRRLKNE